METVTAVQPAAKNGVAKFSEDTVGSVLAKITTFQTNGDLKLPENYSPENAIRSAWLIIQEVKNMDKRPALEVCSKESIANALLDMVLQGLNPVKKQCYFVVYGTKLMLQKSYIGNIMISKRVANVKEVKAVPIYEGDVFEYEINTESGRKKVTKHEQKFTNIDPEKVVGAYAIVTENDGNQWTEIMNMKQIRKAWDMGNAKGNSPAHKNFADEMACKTVANRALKIAIGSSDDGDLFEETEPGENRFTADVKAEISANANKGAIGFDEQIQNAEEVKNEENVDKETGEVKETAAAEEPVQQNSGTLTKAPF